METPTPLRESESDDGFTTDEDSDFDNERTSLLKPLGLGMRFSSASQSVMRFAGSGKKACCRRQPYVLTFWALIDLMCWMPTIASIFIVLLSDDYMDRYDEVTGDCRTGNLNGLKMIDASCETHMIWKLLTQKYVFVLLYSLSSCVRILKFERRIQAFATI